MSTHRRGRSSGAMASSVGCADPIHLHRRRPNRLTPSSRTTTLLGLVAILFWSTSVGVTRSTIEHLGPTGAPAVMFTLSTLFLLPRRTPLRELPRLYPHVLCVDT
eukprot:Opistho-1_new@98941